MTAERPARAARVRPDDPVILAIEEKLDRVIEFQNKMVGALRLASGLLGIVTALLIFLLTRAFPA